MGVWQQLYLLNEILLGNEDKTLVGGEYLLYMSRVDGEGWWALTLNNG